MPEVTDVNRFVKDSAYAAIGFGVLGFQRAQVRRRELTEQLGRQGTQLSQLGEKVTAQLNGDPVATVRTTVFEVAKRIDTQVQPVRRQLDDRLSEVEELLPAPTRTVVRSIRSAAHNQEAALRSAIGLGV